MILLKPYILQKVVYHISGCISALKEFGVESFIEEMRCACINTRKEPYCFFAELTAC